MVLVPDAVARFRVFIIRVTFLSIRRAWRWYGSQVYAPGGCADGKRNEKMESW